VFDGRMKIESHLKHNSFFCFHICFRGMSPFSFYHTYIAWWQSWIWLKIGNGSIIWGSNTKNRSEKFLTVTIHLISVKIRLFFLFFLEFVLGSFVPSWTVLGLPFGGPFANIGHSWVHKGLWRVLGWILDLCWVGFGKDILCWSFRALLSSIEAS
jgi:hypothetical protein